jgi:hypothetical protein
MLKAIINIALTTSTSETRGAITAVHKIQTDHKYILNNDISVHPN